MLLQGTGNAMYGNEGAYHMGNFPAMDGMFHRTTVATSVRGKLHDHDYHEWYVARYAHDVQ